MHLMTVLCQGFCLHKRRRPNVPAPKRPAPISIVGIVTTTVTECNTRCPIVTIATATASKTPSNCHNRPFDRCSSHLLQANLYLNLILSLGLQHRSYTQTEVPVNILRLSNTYNDCHRSIANVARVPSFPCSGEPRYRITCRFFLPLFSDCHFQL